ncbi:PREDICTED: N-acetyltransferase 9-like protein isoform X3 [Dinoponera quadriceps]|uniref:N-acetyltransferase 9-like protein isoform X3 n=1 Tax=Dinoponera quadriceps TaxID=609295 RepID=A0A6P3XI84_DINQU|nr:PREDICTED: N-acetyltransferase 9-like protein isoform X3 [Dinoponera quadriceps]
MRKNANTRITGTNVILVPYQKKHVAKYHEWMKCPMLRYLTGSEPLTLEEEFEMQIHWLEDEDKCTFIILDKHVFDSTESEAEAMIGDTNLFFNDPQEPHIAEVEIMIADEASRGKKRGWESCILMIQYGMSLMEAKSDILRECRMKFLHTFQTSCEFWLPVQLVNFLLVPASLRVTYVSVASFCWVNILCYLKNIPVVECIEDKVER